MSMAARRFAGFLVIAAFGTISAAFGAAEALADPAIGRTLASQCAQCHGTNGNSVGGIEGLAGEDATSIYHEMIEMKYGNEELDIMHAQARAYTDAQLLEISQYLATLPGDSDD